MSGTGDTGQGLVLSTGASLSCNSASSAFLRCRSTSRKLFDGFDGLSRQFFPRHARRRLDGEREGVGGSDGRLPHERNPNLDFTLSGSRPPPRLCHGKLSKGCGNYFSEEIRKCRGRWAGGRPPGVRVVRVLSPPQRQLRVRTCASHSHLPFTHHAQAVICMHRHVWSATHIIRTKRCDGRRRRRQS